MSIFGSALRVSTFGESHGCSVGCVIDGLPGGLQICTSCVQRQLQRRRPGAAAAASSSCRNEPDTAEIISGVEHDLTLGSPVCIIIKNKDTRKQDYSNIGINENRNKEGALSGIPRPGHAELTYLLKYKNMSNSGGGRSSARETAARVAAAALIEYSLLSPLSDCRVVAFVASVGIHSLPQQEIARDATGNTHPGLAEAQLAVLLQQQDSQGASMGGPPPDAEKGEEWSIHTRCPHITTAVQMARALLEVRAEGDSIGGSVCCVVANPPAGLGEEFAEAALQLKCTSNRAGGTLGGISTGENIYFRVGFKPPSSISKTQVTSDFNGDMQQLNIKGRHDPCVVARAVPVVEAMAVLVIGDLVMQQASRVGFPFLRGNANEFHEDDGEEEV